MKEKQIEIDKKITNSRKTEQDEKIKTNKSEMRGCDKHRVRWVRGWGPLISGESTPLVQHCN